MIRLFPGNLKRIVFVGILLLNVSLAANYAQSTTIDSLEQLLDSKIDTVRLDAHYFLGMELRHSDPERSLDILKKCAEESKKLGEKNRLQKAITSIGVSYGMAGDYAESIQHFSTALGIAQEINNKAAEASNYSNIGIVYKSLGDYPTSMEYYTKAMEINHENNDSIGLASCYGNIGVLYDLLDDLDQSMAYYEKSIAIGEAIGKKQVSLILNIALLKIKKKEFEEALDMLNEYLKLNQEEGRQSYQLLALQNISHCYIEMGQYELAERFARSALDLSREWDYKNDIANGLTNLTNSLIGQERYIDALAAANEQLDVARQTGSLKLISIGYQLQKKVFSLIGDYESAYNAQTEYVSIQDSTFSVEKADALQRWEAQLKVKEKEQQLKAQNLQLELLETKVKADQRWKLILGLIAFLLATIAFFFQRQNRLRKKGNALLRSKNEQIESQNHEIEEINKELEKRMLRAQINPHFIFNSLSSIQHFITTNDRRSALRYLSKFSNLLRQVLESSINVNVVLAEEIQLLQTYLELEALRFDQDFQFEIKTDPEIDIYATEVPVLLVQPFIENAILHGLLPKKGDRQLLVAFDAGPGYTICRVVDNGIGRAASVSVSKKSGRPSRGISVTQKRLQTLQGDSEDNLLEIIDLKDENGQAAGTEVVIRIPK